MAWWVAVNATDNQQSKQTTCELQLLPLLCSPIVAAVVAAAIAAVAAPVAAPVVVNV